MLGGVDRLDAVRRAEVRLQERDRGGPRRLVGGDVGAVVDVARRERREVPRDGGGDDRDPDHERLPPPQRKDEHGERNRDEAQPLDVPADLGRDDVRRDHRGEVGDEDVAEHARALDASREREAEEAERAAGDRVGGMEREAPAAGEEPPEQIQIQQVPKAAARLTLEQRVEGRFAYEEARACQIGCRSHQLSACPIESPRPRRPEPPYPDGWS